MNTSQIIQDYQTYLDQHHNPTRAKKEKAYLYSDNKFYGLSAWDMQKHFKSLRPQLKTFSKKQFLQLVNQLWFHPIHEYRIFALHILEVHQDQLTEKDMPLIEKLMHESGGWVYLDNLIIPIMPSLLQKYPQTYSYLNKWIKSDDFWVRRSALLAQLLYFRRGQGGNKQLFFDLAASQLDESWIDHQYQDTETKKRARFFIRKAIGWTLREMAKTDPKSVVTYVNQHKNQMSGLTYREATRILSPSYLSKLQKL